MKKLKNLFTKKTILKDLDNILPIAMNGTDGLPLKDLSFSFMDWDMEVEEEIGEERQKSKNNGQWVTKLLCRLLDRFCGVNFQDLTDDQKLMRLHNMPSSNVYYMFVYLRYDQIGPKIRTDFKCASPGCGKQINNYECSLEDMDIHVKDHECSNHVLYELHKPILYDGKTISKVKYDYTKWYMYEKTEREDLENPGRFKRINIESAAAGFHNGTGVIEQMLDPRQVIKKMKKKDIEQSLNKILENNGGCRMMIKVTCPYCTDDFYQVVNTEYDHFFGS